MKEFMNILFSKEKIIAVVQKINEVYTENP